MSVFLHKALAVDQITITIKIPAIGLHQQINQKLWTLPMAIKKHFPGGSCKPSKSKKANLVRACIYPEASQKHRLIAAISAGMTKSAHRYFSVTLYPGKMEAGEFAGFKAFLGEQFPEFCYEKLYYTGRVSRLDLALDILSRLKTELVPYRPRCRVVNVYQGGGTTYLGSHGSDLMFRIYDKVKQLLETGKPPSSHACLTRVEARMQSIGCSPSELLQKLKNPFAVLHVAELISLRCVSDTAEWHTFLDLAELSGYRLALNAVPKGLREVFSKRLKAGAAWWWKPAAFWGGLAAALVVLEP